jgi:hypothetical protein
MGLSITPLSEGMRLEQDYHNDDPAGRLLSPPRAPVEEDQEVPARQSEKQLHQEGWPTQDLRPGGDQRHLVRALDRMPAEGRPSGLVRVSSSVIHERFQRWTKLGIFEKVMRRMLGYYARQRARRRGLEVASDGLEEFSSPARGQQNGQEPHR